MDIFTMSYTCTRINLPICRVFHKTGCLQNSRSVELPFFVLYSPATITFLITATLCAIHFLRATNRHYAALGRKEFALFFQIYILTLLCDIFLVSTQSTNRAVILVEFCLASTCSATLFLGGLMPVIFADVGFFKGIVVLRSCAFAYFLALLLILSAAPIGLMVFCALIISAIFVLLYGISQLILLVRSDAEVWAYGTLAVSSAFFLIGAIFLGIGAELATFLSERYLDGLFFFHLMMFCSVIMVHKYWLSICDFEAECAPLIKDEDEGLVKT